MTKIISITLLLLICAFILISCNNQIPTIREEQTSTKTLEMPQNETSNVETSDIEDNIGGYKGCSVHSETYHMFSFSGYIDKDKLSEWVNSTNDEALTDGCSDGKNLYNCIRYFDISRENLEKIYYDWAWYTTVWNFEALYSDDPSVADKYYRDKDQIDNIIEKRSSLMSMKTKIARDHWDEWTALYGEKVPTPQHSVKYLVELFDIPRDKIESYVVKYDGVSTYDYDFDALYALVDGTATIEDPTPIKEDAFFCGFEDLYIE